MAGWEGSLSGSYGLVKIQGNHQFLFFIKHIFLFTSVRVVRLIFLFLFVFLPNFLCVLSKRKRSKQCNPDQPKNLFVLLTSPWEWGCEDADWVAGRVISPCHIVWVLERSMQRQMQFVSVSLDMIYDAGPPASRWWEKLNLWHRPSQWSSEIQ